MHPLKSFGTLHTTAVQVQHVLKSPACYIFGAIFKTAPKTQLPIELNRKCVKNVSKMRFWCIFLSHVSMFHKCMMGVRHVFKNAYAFFNAFFFAPKGANLQSGFVSQGKTRNCQQETSIFAPIFIYYTYIVIFYCGCFMALLSVATIFQRNQGVWLSQAMAPCFSSFHKSLGFKEEIWLQWPTVAITSRFNTCILNSALWIWAQTNTKPACYNALSVCCGVYLCIYIYIYRERDK